MLFYLSLVAFFFLVVMLTYRYRAFIIPHVPDRVKSFLPRILTTSPTANHYAPLSTFNDQVNAGMTSDSFDVEANNISVGDSRMGLDERGTREVMEIMNRERVK
ncbi:hypothetical protein FA15DRAFT_703952 [Coprinopsis marcescibilis]|uniref:Uncharacterized protein n=1 Tax=Coprinopsis marcescibilis TaxID=230819 RepID=A0A5C3KXG7_COPMA|nr:hypothetical protein FA15DRAFT_703952 [Coprinopsis marcescibilis]